MILMELFLTHISTSYNMFLRRRWVVFSLLFLFGCFLQNDPFLDPSIPRVVTPTEQIAFVRTKWQNGKLRQTTFLDKQSRILEDFVYGYTSQKTLYRYVQNRLVSTKNYYHSDSSPTGYLFILERELDYDQSGRVRHIRELHTSLTAEKMIQGSALADLFYRYRSPYDTLIRRVPPLTDNDSSNTYINRWERNRQGQLIRNFQLAVIKNRDHSADTTQYYSHRFAYDKLGRRTLAWFDLMYLGQFYYPAGPDTIRYEYDNQSRLVREVHRYTTDMRNKVELDTTGIDKSNWSSIAVDRKRFFEGSTYFPKNDKMDLVEYRYEPFDPVKHLPLHTSQDVGY